MKKKDIHLVASIILLLIGLIVSLNKFQLDNPVDNKGLLLFGMFILGGYGIAKYVYDK